jgi:hypothetical protein
VEYHKEAPLKDLPLCAHLLSTNFLLLPAFDDHPTMILFMPFKENDRREKEA